MDISHICKQHKLRLTQERKKIFIFLQEHHLVSSAQMIEHFPDIGRASVFRALKCFLDIGVIRRINLWENYDLYEINDTNHHHEHMKCKHCNGVIPFHCDTICAEVFTKAKEMWFSIDEHQISVLGTCKKCLEGKPLKKHKEMTEENGGQEILK